GEREAHASVDRMTFFDPLTELPNRHFLHGRLQHLLRGAATHGVALLLIDLDHFKRVNDLRGHAAGDRLLALIAQRLRKLLDEDSVLSRFSGGTFALLLPCRAADPLARTALVSDCAEQVREALRMPFQLGDDVPVRMTVSIGWTELVPGRDSPESVLKQAELATYAARSPRRRWSCTCRRRSTGMGAWSVPRCCCAGPAPTASRCRPNGSSPSPRRTA